MICIISLITSDNIFNIFLEVNNIFKYKYKQVIYQNDIIDTLLTQKSKDVIIELEFINYDFNLVISLKHKITSNIIVILDEYYFDLYKDRLINNNISDIIINYSNTQIKKELIQILHSPNNFNITQKIAKPISNLQSKSSVKSVKHNKVRDSAKALYLFKKYQRKLKKRYNVNNNKVLLVERKNLLKTITNIFIRCFKASLNILIFLLASIGLISIIYPITRNSLIDIFNSFINELNSLF